MDNKGGVTGNPMMPGEQAGGVSPSMTGEASFGVPANNPESLMANLAANGENMEQAPMGGEQMQNAEPMPAAPDMVQAPLPPVELAAPKPQEAESTETPALAEFKSIKIERNAEKIPKEVLSSLDKIIKTNANDPYQLVADLDEARWDYEEKRHARKLGDGLNGTGAA
jgi:hypothetical protein